MTLEHGEGGARETTDDRRDCPFCPGMERDTPNEVFAVRDQGSARDGPGWRLRVVPNKFPAVRPDAPTAFGFHELIVETERHVSDPTALTDDECARLLVTYRDRWTALHAQPGIRSATIFKNVGSEAGASLAHAHSQIVATPFDSAPQALKRDRAEAYRVKHGRSLWADHLTEAEAGGRVVKATAHFALLAAFAPRMSGELLLVPRFDVADFGATSDEMLRECSLLLKAGATALDRAFHRPAYNWWLHAAPPGTKPDAFRWHFEILPRTARIAGFEWASDCFIVAVSPEAAAARLRSRLPTSVPRRT